VVSIVSAFGLCGTLKHEAENLLDHFFIKGCIVGIIALDNLTTGMVLADDVHDRSGRLLLGCGSELSQKHLVIFRTWGVSEVNIAGSGESDGHTSLPLDVTPEELARAEKSLEPIFRIAGTDHPVMKEILQLAALRKVTHGQK
jgi:hypothetical protein